VRNSDQGVREQGRKQEYDKGIIARTLLDGLCIIVTLHHPASIIAAMAHHMYVYIIMYTLLVY
jgi:hypothetical protein